MNLNLSIPQNIENVQPKISVIGVGGAGCNAVNTMINSKVNNINFLVANTDGQALSRSMAKTQIQLGKELTNGLGAGSDYTVGEQAAHETIDEIMMELEDVNMLFIATGMGGGTGTGAAPIIAQKAKEKGILTIAVVTKPFDFEGKKRMETALIGLEKLENSVDTLIVIPNQNLFRIANDKTTFSEAFQLADDVLYQGIIGITDLITSPGMINLDFSDIKTVMKNKGQAMMGTGEHSGENRAKIAAEMALNNPLLDNSSIDGASSILLNIKGGLDLALFEVDEAASLIRAKVNENANIIFGSSIDESLDGIINVSVVATGININQSIKSEEVINRNINQGEVSEIDDHSSKIEGQIDLESKIADLNKISDSEKTTAQTEKDSLTFLETKEKELSAFFKNRKSDLLKTLVPLTKNMEARGGGVMSLDLIDKCDILENYYQLHLRFKTGDAMGANFINSCLEHLAKSLIQFASKDQLSNENNKPIDVLMSILSNYVPECLVHAEVSCPIKEFNLDNHNLNLETFTKRMIQAVAIAKYDPYRAVTHNKGIMNGVDSLVIATGNDFRAIEAGVHAYAASSGQYRSLSDAYIKDDKFVMELSIPLALGTVGGLTKLHPMVNWCMELLGNPSSEKLMEIIAVAGLAQNFGALRSLVTTGIQKGHMKMHLLSILNGFGATTEEKNKLVVHFKNETVSNAAVQKALGELRK